ncbi:hypothetical protein [Sinorhizobium sojae]|uniref:hypothetical protein n=1 Tax=Sinorhizobium sojae TaxID=716925 RepID=UPI000553DF6D|nr:hypothetical protein [Sinorhizobium sojae]
MAVDAVSPNRIPTGGATPSPSTAPEQGVTRSGTKKVDPNSDGAVLQAAVEAFLPSMISNTLMLNNSLFNFAKEAIDEGNEG